MQCRDHAAALRVDDGPPSRGQRRGDRDPLRVTPDRKLARGLSRSALERRFQKVLSRTPKEEMLRVQLNRAMQLLAETDQPLEAVAGKTGFSSAKYFGEIFHRKRGIGPSAYRRRSRGGS
ncbi:MAG: helix-turn-helix transcriptional regulator [Gemmataceae bacterium]|nr:helix-turn-helix transcriptional regulator [Gemmataceae bacterium]